MKVLERCVFCVLEIFVGKAYKKGHERKSMTGWSWTGYVRPYTRILGQPTSEFARRVQCETAMLPQKVYSEFSWQFSILFGKHWRYSQVTSFFANEF